MSVVPTSSTESGVALLTRNTTPDPLDLWMVSGLAFCGMICGAISSLIAESLSMKVSVLTM
jgi:hypothetical protein